MLKDDVVLRVAPEAKLLRARRALAVEIEITALGAAVSQHPGAGELACTAYKLLPAPVQR